MHSRFCENHNLSHTVHGDFLDITILKLSDDADLSLPIPTKWPQISICKLATKRLTPAKGYENGVRTLENGAKTCKSVAEEAQIRLLGLQLHFYRGEVL